ncbi:Maltose permease MAL31 [Fulvia fulva]|uniref:Maltose permease MAL31 n=1 Tax=Passalora fulva TaxID=5499 RepID=A0A9Q8PI85_PASFU|nr:Maltose permease MAL31 [Fulvia fulva]KAK4626681.1 Maltose permease MAL31 [Fulvia fulva]KAK4628185.1 Maltose permease MAL31 [Fulvia fulva]UJO22938.1 Maltose permease MAL31 [Fulvia fulva]WPV13427.1 Maltose permease MAL31 [Fulvia fulva]WPV28052.1 Maltose permease MAL31 [Fulvia fulva]
MAASSTSSSSAAEHRVVDEVCLHLKRQRHTADRSLRFDLNPDERRPLLPRPLLKQKKTNMTPPIDPEEDATTHDVLKGDITIGSIAGDEARQALEHEHNLSFLEALRLYPQAVFWSIFFSLGVIMTAFDPQLLGNLYATPAFQRDFGYLYEGSYIISAPWQTGLSMGNPIGQVVGAFFAAYPMEWYGRKKTFGACVVLTAGFIFIQFFARSLKVLLAGELLGGLVLGTYAVIAPAYASEVCPVALRGVLTSYVNMCFVIGQLIANGVIAGTSQLDSRWAYSGPFAAQWVWPLIILVGLPFAPESPWWLVRKGKLEAAENALTRLASEKVDVKPTLAMIIETDRLEQELEAGSTYSDCFKKINLRRTEIATGVYCIQVISGVYLVGYATYFFELAGLPTQQAFNMSLGFLALGFLGTVFSWFLLIKCGRRTIYSIGLLLLVILMLLIGILDCVPNYEQKHGVIWAQSSLMLIWNFCYDFSVGPVCFVILCEVSATKVRSKTIGVATASQALLAIGMTVAIPYMINPDQGNMRGKIGFFYGGLSAISLVWVYFRVPETKGRTYEELDIMFSRGVGTRQFKKYRVE